MKKILVTLGLVFFLLVGCTNEKVVKETDSIKFKEEYEKYNEKTTNNNKKYLEVSIEEENPIKYVEYDELIDILKNKTGIIYFGFPECPWCRNAVPVLLETVQEFGIDTIYYFNDKSIRDQKHLDEDGNIVVDKEGTKEYRELVEVLYDHLGSYDGLNDDTIKRLYFPTVLFVKEGNILGLHVSTVDSQKDPYTPLNEIQYAELKQIYSEYINKTYNILCDEAC